mgnify:CR=1 FL=1
MSKLIKAVMTPDDSELKEKLKELGIGNKKSNIRVKAKAENMNLAEYIKSKMSNRQTYTDSK